MVRRGSTVRVRQRAWQQHQETSQIRALREAPTGPLSCSWNRYGTGATKTPGKPVSLAASGSPLSRYPELPRESAALQRPEDGVVVEAVADDETLIVDCDSRALAVAFEQR